MELPTLPELKSLLREDSIFRDYFNAFLNLPVFAKRLTFSSHGDKFILEPRVKPSYHSLNDVCVWRWVLCSRLPLFWSSDLHLESRLAMRLHALNPPNSAVKCSVSLMDKFRRFLCETEGEGLWCFWRDVERLRLTKDKHLSQKVFHFIQLTYLQDGAPVNLPGCVKEKAVLCAKRAMQSAPVCRVTLLFEAQSVVMNELVKYWTLRYDIHLECSLKRPDSESISQTFSLEVECGRDTSEHQPFLPSIIFDEGNMGGDKRPEKVQHIKMNEFSLSSLIATNKGPKVHRDITPLITPSTHSLFPQKSDLAKHPLQQDIPVLPHLMASLRADALAGHSFLLYLIKNGGGVYNHLLFWQSVEILLAQDEMTRWHKMNTSLRYSDQLIFFEEYSVARDLTQLVGMFLKGRAPHRVELPGHIKRRELCVLAEKGLGHNLLLTAQEHSAKVLLTHWQAYLLDDHQSFMNSCTSRRVMRHNLCRSLTVEYSPSPCQLLQMVFDPSSMHSVWTALKYAESAKYHGIHLLPSRSQPSLCLAPSTYDDEYLLDLVDVDTPLSVEGMALSPMVTTICDQLLYDWEQSKIKRTLLCTTTHSYDTTKRPQMPTSIMEVLKDRDQLEFFRHYLFMQGTTAEMPLQFWMAVEEIKTCLENKRAFSSKLRRIQERFFVGKGGGSHLSHHPVFYELSKRSAPSILELIAAQVEVVKSLEKNWFNEYVTHLRAKEEEEIEKEEERKSTCRASTKGLWGMFAHNVIGFRRGLMSSATAEQFRGFLREEAIKGNSGHSKKLIGTKVVNVTKLLNDLSFWAEVERYKDLVDMIRAGKEIGTHTPEDDLMIHKKAHAIVNCYIDSSVSPRVQINIPSDLVTYILDNLSQGLITRGLFHEAALNIFSVLILFWKRFCVARFAPREKEQSAGVRGRSASIVPVQDLVEEKDHHCFWDGGPILSFNLSAGVRWHYPANYHLLLQSEQEAKNNTLIATA